MEPTRPDSSPAVEPGRIISIAVWFGLLGGLTEVAVLAVRKWVFGEIVFKGLDAGWMVPAAGFFFFLILGLAYGGIHRFFPRIFSVRIAALLFGFLASFGVLFMFVPRLHKYAALILACGIAVQASNRIAQAPGRFDSLRRRTLKAMIGVFGALALGIPATKALKERTATRRLRPHDPGDPNVIVVVLDTVRSDNLSLQGYNRPTSPHMERWSAAGVQFDNAIAPSPWTLPSHASMFTGRLPHELSANWLTPLDTTYPTLAEFFRARGYLTAGFAANTGYCSPEFGLTRGFNHYEDYQISVDQAIADASLGRYATTSRRIRRLVDNHQILGRKSGGELTDSFLSWLSGTEGRPFFAFLNYYDAHAPYIPPPPFAGRFGTHRPVESSPWARREDIPAQEIQAMIDNYDASIAYVDHQLGMILDAMIQRDLAGNTLVVITSDHGEEFGEHGFFDHGNTLYRHSVRVPLVVSFPGKIPGGARVSSAVSLRDLATTIVEMTHGQGSSPFPGESLSRGWSGPRPGVPNDIPIVSQVRQARNVPAWLPVQKGDMYALEWRSWRYIRNGDGREELYDIEQDPGETRDVSGSRSGRRVLPGFRASLEAMLRA